MQKFLLLCLLSFSAQGFATEAHTDCQAINASREAVAKNVVKSDKKPSKAASRQ